MPRKPRLFVPGAIYHVYCRVTRGEFVFDDPWEAEEFVEVVRGVRDLDGWTLLAWCLMGNHYHLVIKTASVPLWRSMARMQRRISRGYNRRHGVCGRLWQSRYKARIIDCEEYLRQAVVYVHLNPVNAGIAVEPCAYRYSGHAAVIGQAPARLIDVAATLCGFGTASVESARGEYHDRVCAVAEVKGRAAGLEEQPWWSEASDGDEIAAIGKHPCAVTYDDRPPVVPPLQLDLCEIIRRFAVVSGFSLDQLVSRTRAPGVVRARMLLASVAVQLHGHQVRHIAHALGRNPGSVSRWLTRHSENACDYPDFQHEMEVVSDEISECLLP